MNSMQRVLKISQALKNGEKLTVEALATEYGRHRETIKRDIINIRDILSQEGIELLYNHLEKCYEARKQEVFLSTTDIYTILSVLHGSRTLNQDELKQLEGRMVNLLPKESRTRLNRLISSYRYHYRPSTNYPLLDLIDKLLDSIVNQTVLEITYVTARFDEKQMKIAPYTIIFDEGYLYVVVRIINDAATDQNENIMFNLRIDRITSFVQTKQTFTVQLSGKDYFKAGEYAQLSAKMFSGVKAKKIKIRVKSNVVSYFEDKFPLYTLLEKTKQWNTYEFEVLNEEGALFWILSERDWVEVLEPQDFREQIKTIIKEMATLYGVDKN